MDDSKKDRPVVLFDGVCNLCNASVQFILKREANNRLLFSPLQSAYSRKLLERFHLPANYLNSILLYENGRLYTTSTAALHITRYLKGLYPLLYGLIILPKFIRDGLYRRIARHRYQWFGKREQCMVPKPGMRERFLD